MQAQFQLSSEEASRLRLFAKSQGLRRVTPIDTP